MHSLRVLAALALGVGLLPAQSKPDFWPGVQYDPSIPTFRKVLGYDPGERISSHANLIRYMEALAAAAPRRMKVFPYAKTWEGRQLIYAAIGSEGNLRRLDEIRAGMQKLSDPRQTNEAEARRLIASLPAVIWLGYGVHGNEISSPDAALLTAYHLLAAKNDKLTEEVLSKVLVLIDPTQNPDGRDRFVRHFEQTEGIEADVNPVAAEHNEPWPMGRTNHYHFDMNRDWFAITQPETRGRVKALREWRPLVFVDLHEMGSDATYYFAPEAVPYNPHLAKDQKASLVWFGQNNAKYFDQFGFNYFTREVYDAFYPGYGASWPSYYGAVAMTYEQASARGLAVRRSDETTFTFRDTVREHFVASLSTAETAAKNRDKLLENYYRYQQTAIEEGTRGPEREYILPRRGNTGNVDKLAQLLAEQGIDVKRATAEFVSGGKTYPAGSYVVPLAQPAKRLIRTLLDLDVPMEPDFLKEQERRRRKKLPDEIYDVTAWSLPLMYNVEAIPSTEVSPGKFEPLKMNVHPPAPTVPGATVAYLVPWDSSAAGRFLTAALCEGLTVHSTDKSFLQNSRQFPGGTLIIRVKSNEAGLAGKVQRLAASTGAEVVATDTGWVDEGVNFGSRYVVTLRRPAVALAWDRPTAAGSAGFARYVLERQYNYPVTVVRTAQLANADLSRFQVLILPESMGEGYGNVLGPNGVRRLKDWVAAGGTVIGIGEAVSFLADPRTGLLAVAAETLARPGEPPKKPEPPEARVNGRILATDADYEKAIQADTESPDAVQGILARVRIDDEHWLGLGAGKSVHALVQGRLVFAPIKLDKGVNVGVFAPANQLVASGYLWEENRRQLAYKPFLLAQREGRGHVIGFTADPNYRGYMDGLNLLFLNAVFRGPAHSR